MKLVEKIIIAWIVAAMVITPISLIAIIVAIIMLIFKNAGGLL